MTRADRFKAVIDYFKITRPEAETELVYSNAYELLTAVILSAQCTDKRVNMTTPALFAQYPNITSLAKARYDDLFAIIKSISFPGNKTRHLIGMAKLVAEKFKGKIPMTVNELVELPG